MQAKDVVAVVTGGASGLGEATARALAAKGARVAIFDMQLEAGQKVAESIGGIAVQCNVADSASAESAFAEVREKLGLCGIVVNCAGVATPGKILGKEGPMPLADYEKVIQVNLIGTFNIMRLAAADMAQREPNDEGERGVVINTASVAAFEGQIGQAAYASSKGGVAALTIQAARELARNGIRVNTIAPGIFMTPMMAGLPQNVQESLAANVPFPPRLGKPDEYALLASQIVENPMLNGSVIRLDAALRMAPK